MTAFFIKLATAFLVLIAATHAAFALDDYKGETPCPAPQSLHDGFYAGVQAGYDSYHVRKNTTTVLGSGNPVLSANGFAGGLFAGYGHYLYDVYYLGAEGFANYSGAQANYGGRETRGFYHSRFNARAGAGLSLLPGIRIAPTLLGYLRLGYNWSNLNTRENLSGVSFNKSHTSGGFNYGVGMESLVYENWSVRSEFTHTNYSSFTSAISAYNVSDNQFMLALVYHFS